MEDKLVLDFCKVFIYNNYMVVIINEGENLNPSHNKVLLNIVDTYYKNNPFVYLTHRLNSYSVDPALYLETSKIENLAGFAVISKDFRKKSAAQIEKLFLNKPFEIFDELHEAVKWASKILDIEFN